jgi:pyruvate/2-oxoglutarate dehydrogenase complex dihydrolipoamide dehydrogenase (E3) component
VETNEYLQTIYPNIYAAGDVAGPFQFTHTAAHQAWYRGGQCLFGDVKKFKTDYSVIPGPPSSTRRSRVGLNEQEAKEKGVAFEVTRYGIDDLDRAIADSERTASSRCSPCRARTASWASPSSARTPATCWPNTCWP